MDSVIDTMISKQIKIGKTMKITEKQTFDSERALYGSFDLCVKDCRFEGERDGESALKESGNIVVENCFFDLRYPFWHDNVLSIKNTELSENCRAALIRQRVKGAHDFCSCFHKFSPYPLTDDGSRPNFFLNAAVKCAAVAKPQSAATDSTDTDGREASVSAAAVSRKSCR